MAYEGVEKIIEFLIPHKHTIKEDKNDALSESDSTDDEKKKVKSAIFTVITSYSIHYTKLYDAPAKATYGSVGEWLKPPVC